MTTRPRDPKTGRFLSNAQIEAMRASTQAPAPERKEREAKEQPKEQPKREPKRNTPTEAQRQINRIIRQQRQQNKEAKEAKERSQEERQAIEAKEQPKEQSKPRAKRIYYKIPTDKKFVSKKRAEEFYKSIGLNLNQELTLIKDLAPEEREDRQRQQKYAYNEIKLSEENAPKIAKIKADIINFQNSEEKKLIIDTSTIRNFSEQILRENLSVLKPRQGYGLFLKNGPNLYALSEINNFMKPEDEQTESEKAIVRAIMESKFIELIQFKRNLKRNKNGGFFPYLNKIKEIDLSKYGVFNKLPQTNYFKENCLSKALILSGIQKEKTDFIIGRTIPKNKLCEIAKILDINIVLSSKTKNILSINPDGKNAISLGLFNNHYFPNDKIACSEYALKNYDKIKHLEDFNLIYSEDIKAGKIYYRKKPDVKITVLKCLELMKENNLLEPMDESTAGILETGFYDKVEKKISNLTIDQTRPIESIEERQERFKKLIDTEEKSEETKESINFIDSWLKNARKERKEQEKRANETLEQKHKRELKENKAIENNRRKQERERKALQKRANETPEQGARRREKEDKQNEAKFQRDIKKAEAKRIKRENRPNKKLLDKEALTFIADYESTTEGERHEEYLLCYSNLQGTLKKCFRGDTATKNFLNDLPDNSTVYFHNLGYDYSFIVKFSQVIPINIIKEGSKVKMFIIVYKNKYLTFKDSYAIISEPLRKFASMFGLDNKKEIMPYKLYNKETVKIEKVNLYSALQHIKQEEKDEFIKLTIEASSLENIERDNSGKIINADFLHMQYAKFYCMKDVEVLREGIVKFHSWIKTSFNIEIFDFVSLPAIAKNYLINSGCFKGCFDISGNTRNFIQKCIIGGRVHLPHGSGEIKEVLNDLDAVSLYPSAMAEMGFLMGEPKILSPDQMNLSFLNDEKTDGYFIEIKNVKVAKRLKAPLQSIKDDTGSRIFTNDFKPEESLFVDKFALEDFIRFQGATFDIVHGYYYNEGRNYEIQKTIKYMFDKRKELKNLGNPAQLVFKLLMNSAYGKTIEKPRLSTLKFKSDFDKDKASEDKFIDDNYDYILNITEISETLKLYKLKNPIEKHFNACHIGAEILSMSKRLMNNVICLAEDLNIDIYYQDTDSMHLKNSDIKTIAEAYKMRYGKVLIGKELGQFHSDLEIEGCKNVLSSGAVFVGKKCYIHKLTGQDVKTGENIEKLYFRIKGAPACSVESLAEKHFNNDIYQIYKNMLAGEKFSFDLLAGRVSFKQNKDLQYTSINEFFRDMQFKTIAPTI